MPLEHKLNTPLARAVREAGSQTAFGALIHKRQSTIHTWLKTDKPLPLEYVPAVSYAYGIPPHELRPDLRALEVPEPAPAAPPLIVPANENGILS
jgi:DNA-binding transcriptional regulator YdaS (Cro superfamily)